LIVTVTLNPAVDEEYLLPEFRPGGWSRATHVDRSPGGKGINVSMILSQLGCESAAMGFLAGFTGEYVRDVLRRHRITTNFVHVPGETRTNVYIVDEIGHIETGIAELGPYIPEDALGRLVTNFDRMLHRAHLVSIGGSLPPGVPQDFYRELVRNAKGKGIPTFIDAAGAPLMAALEAGPTVAKIDHRFMARVAGIPLTSIDNLIEIVSKVHDQGVEYAVTSYRSYGDVFFTPEGIYLAALDRRNFVSMFGAGDALMAGLVVAYDERMSAEECVRFSMACAYEDSLHVEKGVRSREAVEVLMDRIEVEKLS
jgi:1-phosphofructokinase family hexose kinase